ncbi:nucleoside deaminase [Brevibacterium sp. UCMA 11752]|nr:nucleoside deaminase [Brevibacterium sp. UCMA 11752]
MGAAALFFFLVNLGSDDTPVAPFVLLSLLALVFTVEEYFSYLKAKKRAARSASDSAASRQADVEAVGATEPTNTDLALLRQTIDLATDARNRGRHPFASMVVSADGSVIASAGNNSMPPEGDPTQHAELSVAAEAARKVPAEELPTATLYTSAEPCVMCTGAIYWTGIGRIVYALSESRLLELTGDDPENPTFDLPCREVIARGQQNIEVLGPLLEDEAAAAHEKFWDRRTDVTQ